MAIKKWTLVNDPTKDIQKTPSGYRYMIYILNIDGLETEVYQAYYIEKSVKDRNHSLRMIKNEIMAINDNFVRWA